DQLRHALSRPPQAGTGRCHRLGMGRIRQQPQGQVLQAHAGRPQTCARGNARVGADHGDSGALPGAARAIVMRQLRAWLRRLANVSGLDTFSRGAQRDREFAEELESHLEMHIDDNLRSGMTREEARRQALIKLGGIEQTKEIYRDRRGLPWLEPAIKDVHFALRLMARSPAVTAVILVTLAIGIGANTAMFSVVNTLLIRPLPYRDSSRLLFVETVD